MNMQNQNQLSVGLLTRVSFSKFDPVSRNKKAALEYASNHGADASMHSSTMRLVHKRFVEPLQKIETETRQQVDTHTLPWEDRGNRLLPADLVPTFQDVMAKLKRRWEHAVDDFVGEWSDIVEDAKRRLNGDFSYSKYPSPDEVRNRFKMVVSFMPMPDNSRLIGSIREQMEELFSERIQDASRDLRERLIAKLTHLSDRCHAVSNGEKTKFFASNVTNVIELCDLLPRMLIQDDPVLLQAIADARFMLDGIDADTIKASESVARDVRCMADAILGSLL